MRRFRRVVLMMVLVALFRPRSSLELQKASLSAAVQDLTSNALGVERMQNYCFSLSYNTQYRDAATIATTLATQLENSFEAQKEAVFALKQKIESIYSNGDLVSTKYNTQCCHMNSEGLSQDFNFAVNVSRLMSCDKISGQAGPGAQQESLYGKLIGVYTDNSHAPVKWQYFGSEKGVANIYPAYKVENCDSFDPRYRPWYTASATPNFKDVVVMVKNNRFTDPRDYSTMIQAASILVNTLNPRDRLAVLMYNSDVRRPALSGCYASSLSTASPANIVKFQNFLLTAPDPLDGNNLFAAFKAAFDYFSVDDISNSRSRAIVVFTDGERIDSSDERDDIRALVSSYNAMNVSLFIFVSEPAQSYVLSSVRSFYESLLPASAISQHHYIELRSELDLREEMQSFYSDFAARWTVQVESTFKPVFIPPYYKSGLDQLVISLGSPCFTLKKGQPNLVGVVGVDLSVPDLLEGIESFHADSMTYAFIIDQEGLVLFHPLLPVPSNRSTSAYLDILTLEHADSFSDVRDSMIRGEEGCRRLNSSYIMPKGNTLHQGANQMRVVNEYCWRPIDGTPFFLCVVNPVNIDFKVINAKSFSVPIQAQYHRLDLLGTDPSTMCSHFNSKVNKGFSTVHLSPEAFEKPTEFLLAQETTQTARYIQTTIQRMSDPKQMLKKGILETVAATAKVNSLWISNQTTPYEDYIVWRYIATPTGVMRIYPGVQLASKNTNIIYNPWYRRAVANLGSTAFSTPHPDVLGTRNVITLSQAIVSKSCNEGPDDYNCSVLAVMAMDITYPSFVRLLNTNTPLCQDTSYRCMVIDGDGFLIAHESFDGTGNEQYVHLSEREPLLSQDMYLSGYLEKIYCYSFQYDDNFTKRPRRKYSYQVTNMVTMAMAELHGGYSTYCIFYSIVPISSTNVYVIVVDERKTDLSLCSRSISCTCNVDWPCSSIPQDCTCPCYDDIPPDSYNPCQETFQNLTGHVCPVPLNVSEIVPVATYLQDSVVPPSCSNQNCDQYSSDFQNCTYFSDCQLCSLPLNDTVQQRCMATCPSSLLATPPNLTVNNSTTVVPTTSFITGNKSGTKLPSVVMADNAAGIGVAASPHFVQSEAVIVWEAIAIVCGIVVIVTLGTVVTVALLWKRRKTLDKTRNEVKSVQDQSAVPAGVGVTQRCSYSESISEYSQSDVGISRPLSSEIFLPADMLHKHQHDIVSMDPSRAGGVWF